LAQNGQFNQDSIYTISWVSDGANGTSGTAGTSGNNGTSGSSGTSGTRGTSGTSGTLLLSGTTDNGLITLSGSIPNAYVEPNLTFDSTLLTLNGYQYFVSNPTDNTYLSSDGKAYGEILKFGATATTPGQIYYLDYLTGSWIKAQADTISNGGTYMLSIAVGSNSDTDGMLIRGFIRSSQFTEGSPGEPLFLSEITAGVTKTSAPNLSGNIVRIVGHVVGTSSNRRVYFNPSSDWIEL
jgi:hypothetical protein